MATSFCYPGGWGALRPPGGGSAAGTAAAGAAAAGAHPLGPRTRPPLLPDRPGAGGRRRVDKRPRLPPLPLSSSSSPSRPPLLGVTLSGAAPAGGAAVVVAHLGGGDGATGRPVSGGGGGGVVGGSGGGGGGGGGGAGGGGGLVGGGGGIDGGVTGGVGGADEIVAAWEAVAPAAARPAAASVGVSSAAAAVAAAAAAAAAASPEELADAARAACWRRRLLGGWWGVAELGGAEGVATAFGGHPAPGIADAAAAAAAASGDKTAAGSSSLSSSSAAATVESTTTPFLPNGCMPFVGRDAELYTLFVVNARNNVRLTRDDWSLADMRLAVAGQAFASGKTALGRAFVSELRKPAVQARLLEMAAADAEAEAAAGAATAAFSEAAGPSAAAALPFAVDPADADAGGPPDAGAAATTSAADARKRPLELSAAAVIAELQHMSTATPVYVDCSLARGAETRHGSDMAALPLLFSGALTDAGFHVPADGDDRAAGAAAAGGGAGAGAGTVGAPAAGVAAAAARRAPVPSPDPPTVASLLMDAVHPPPPQRPSRQPLFLHVDNVGDLSPRAAAALRDNIGALWHCLHVAAVTLGRYPPVYVYLSGRGAPFLDSGARRCGYGTVGVVLDMLRPPHIRAIRASLTRRERLVLPGLRGGGRVLDRKLVEMCGGNVYLLLLSLRFLHHAAADGSVSLSSAAGIDRALAAAWGVFETIPEVVAELAPRGLGGGRGRNAGPPPFGIGVGDGWEGGAGGYDGVAYGDVGAGARTPEERSGIGRLLDVSAFGVPVTGDDLFSVGGRGERLSRLVATLDLSLLPVDAASPRGAGGGGGGRRRVRAVGAATDGPGEGGATGRESGEKGTSGRGDAEVGASVLAANADDDDEDDDSDDEEEAAAPSSPSYLLFLPGFMRRHLVARLTTPPSPSAGGGLSATPVLPPPTFAPFQPVGDTRFWTRTALIDLLIRTLITISRAPPTAAPRSWARLLPTLEAVPGLGPAAATLDARRPVVYLPPGEAAPPVGTPGRNRRAYVSCDSGATLTTGGLDLEVRQMRTARAMDVRDAIAREAVGPPPPPPLPLGGDPAGGNDDAAVAAARRKVLLLLPLWHGPQVSSLLRSTDGVVLEGGPASAAGREYAITTAHTLVVRDVGGGDNDWVPYTSGYARPSSRRSRSRTAAAGRARHGRAASRGGGDAAAAALSTPPPRPSEAFAVLTVRGGLTVALASERAVSALAGPRLLAQIRAAAGGGMGCDDAAAASPAGGGDADAAAAAATADPTASSTSGGSATAPSAAAAVAAATSTTTAAAAAAASAATAAGGGGGATMETLLEFYLVVHVGATGMGEAELARLKMDAVLGALHRRNGSGLL